jgi:hypothetical protein
MKYRLEKSKDSPDWWVLTDLDNLIVLKFKEHEFNETQQVSVIDEQKLFKKAEASGMDGANYIAHVMQEMGDFMFDCHYSVALPTPVFEVRQAEDGSSTSVIRHKYPRFTVTVDDECDADKLGSALKKAGEYLQKRYKR